MNKELLREFLEEKYNLYNNSSFSESDPISVPHQFSKKEDIEIAAFLTATIAWGQRTTIIKNANALMQRMDYSPHEFIISAEGKDLKSFVNFKHRTFNGEDCIFFILSLRNIYQKHGGLQKSFVVGEKKKGLKIEESISTFRDIFFEIPHLVRTTKHISDPGRNSAAKRINMFLRWMVRKDKRGVDFGLWNQLKSGELVCPLDIHSGNTARKLGILKRNQNDWIAAIELTEKLKEFDPVDPVKYDFALFGLGVFEKF